LDEAMNGTKPESIDRLDAEEYAALRKRINKTVKRVWREIEDDFAPQRRKYA
jgi:hypothetical protein